MRELAGERWCVRMHVGTPDCTRTGARDTGRTWHSLQQYAVRLHLEQSSSLCCVLRQSLLSQARESAHSAPAAAAASPVFDMTASLQRMAARAAASPTEEAGLLSPCLAPEPASSRPAPRSAPYRRRRAARRPRRFQHGVARAAARQRGEARQQREPQQRRPGSRHEAPRWRGHRQGASAQDADEASLPRTRPVQFVGAKSRGGDCVVDAPRVQQESAERAGKIFDSAGATLAGPGGRTPVARRTMREGPPASCLASPLAAPPRASHRHARTRAVRLPRARVCTRARADIHALFCRCIRRRGLADARAVPRSRQPAWAQRPAHVAGSIRCVPTETLGRAGAQTRRAAAEAGPRGLAVCGECLHPVRRAPCAVFGLGLMPVRAQAAAAAAAASLAMSRGRDPWRGQVSRRRARRAARMAPC